MSRWNETFNTHQFQATWEDLKKKLEEYKLPDNTNESIIVELARLNKVIAYIDGLLQNIDPELIISAHLNSLNTHIAKTRDEVNNFIGNNNIGHLHNANNNIEQVLHLVRLNSLNSKNLETTLTSAITAYNETINKYLTRFDEIHQSQEKQHAEYVNKINTWYEDQQQNITDVNTNLDTIKQTIEGQTAEFNKTFQESEKTRASKFDKVIDSLTTKADSEFAKLAEKLGKALKVTLDYEEQIKRVLNVVVNTAQAGSYQSYANEEKKAANWYRYGAMAFMFFGVSFIIIPEIMHFINDMKMYTFDWKNGFQRAAVSMVMFVPAFYLAKESAKHRMNEVKNRQRELVLCTIDPYLELLEETKRQELKGDIAKRIFGDVESGVDNNDTANILAQVTNLTKNIMRHNK